MPTSIRPTALISVAEPSGEASGAAAVEPIPTDLGTLGSSGYDILQDAGRVVTQTTAAQEDAAAQALARQAGEALGRVQYFGGYQATQGWVGSLDYMEQVSEAWARSIGVFNIGTLLSRVIRAFFGAVRPAAQRSVELGNKSLAHLHTDWNAWLNWSLPRNPYIQSIQHGTAKGIDLTPVYDQLRSLQHNVATEESQIRDLYARIQGATHPNTGPIVSLESQVHALQTRVSEQANQIAKLQTQTQTQAGEIAALRTDVERLTAHLHGVDTTVTTWTEVEARAQQALTQVAQQLTATQAQVQQNTSGLSVLAPLAVLTYLGTKGINNLRKLERNPCQCPHLPRFPNEAGSALAIYEFLTHG